MRCLSFWFEFASTYSYLTAMRIGTRAAERGVEVSWKPFLLGPIFQAQGWDNSPFNVYPAKGRYMWRDVARRAERLGIPFRPNPDTPFPQNGLHAARMAIVGLQSHWGQEFCQSVYRAQFTGGKDIGNADLITALAREAGASQAEVEAATSTENKEKLRKQTEEAVHYGLFGAPSFTVGDELFWGDDRLEDALDWAHRS